MFSAGAVRYTGLAYLDVCTATLHLGYKAELGMNTSFYGQGTGMRTLPGSGSASIHAQCSSKSFQDKIGKPTIILYKPTYIFVQVLCNPQPSFRDILDSTSVFIAAINRSLKMGVNRECHININFRTDIFQFLFKNKGSNYSHGSGQFISLEDFDTTFFTAHWHRVHDKLGDGCEVIFPMRLHSRVK